MSAVGRICMYGKRVMYALDRNWPLAKPAFHHVSDRVQMEECNLGYNWIWFCSYIVDSQNEYLPLYVTHVEVPISCYFFAI